MGKRDGIECAKELWHGGLVRRDRVGNLRAAMIVADCAAPHSAMVSSDRWVASMAVTARLSIATGGNRLPRALRGSGRVAKAAARAGGIGARVGIDCLERSLGNAGCQLSPLSQVSVSCFPLSNTHKPCFSCSIGANHSRTHGILCGDDTIRTTEGEWIREHNH